MYWVLGLHSDALPTFILNNTLALIQSLLNLDFCGSHVTLLILKLFFNKECYKEVRKELYRSN